MRYKEGVQFRILGSLEVADGDAAISLDAPKQRALLGVLLLHPNEVVSTERLIDELWGERPPATAVKVVQTYVSQLRKSLRGDLIDTRPPGYLLRIDEDAVDAGRFRRLSAEGHQLAANGDHERADALYRQALGLWRGPPLADVTFESFARSEVERLEEERLAALMDRVDCELALGHHDELVSELESLVKQHPLRERPRAQLMLALYRSGRQADALAVYRDARRTLVEELGIEPGRELQELERAILAHEPALEAPRARPVLVRARRGRGRLVVLSAVGAAALAVALPFAFRSGEAGLSTVPPNAVGVIDPGSNKLVDAVSVGVGPEAVAVGAGGVWIANVEDETVSLISPTTRRLVRTIQVDDYPSDLAISGRSVWVAFGAPAMLSRVAPNRSRPISALGDERVACGPPFASLAVRGSTARLVCERGQFGRVDLRTGRSIGIGSEAGTLISPSAVLPRFSDIAFGLGSLWLANRAANAITEIDPATNRPLRPITVGQEPTAIAVGERELWVTNFGDDTVTRIAIEGRLRPPTETAIPVGDGPVDVAVGSGGVWVVNSRDGTVSRIDPAKNAVVATIPVGDEPRRVAAGVGGIWVTVRAREQERRR